MNRYDERYEIRLANKKDIEAIMNFLDKHWKKGHILSSNRELFEYEFVEGENVNFIIALDRNTGSLEAIAGFLKCSMTNDVNKRDLWGSIWKVNDTTANMSFLGVELIRRLKEFVPHRYHLGIGINPNTTVPIRKVAFHETIKKMNHYYMINDSIEKYKIAIINEIHSARPIKHNCNMHVRDFETYEEYAENFDIGRIDNVPYKDNWYIKKRFFEHPICKYNVCGVYFGEECEAVLIYRIVECEGSRCIRGIDFLGKYSVIGELGEYFVRLIKENNAEYIDFYNSGIDKTFFETAGFEEQIDDKNIIPNYFGPFVQKNIDIWTRAQDKKTIFFKGDGDQDRPSK